MEAKEPISITYAIPVHPWVDSGDGAQVRIAMTAAEKGVQTGRLNLVVEERETGELGREVMLREKTGIIHSDIKVGANVSVAKTLKANENVGARGIIPHGAGFILNEDEKNFLILEDNSESIIKPYRNGRDINQIPRQVYIIDTFGFTEKQLRSAKPKVYQWLLERVKPERDQNKDKTRRENWWLHARSNEKLRNAIKGLERYVVTVQTFKYRNFTFLNGAVMPDDKLIAIGSEDAFFLGVLSSKIHTSWASATGGRMGVVMI